MSMGVIIIVTALAYLGALFLVAYWGDRRRAREKAIRQSQTWIYPLSLAVYCTSWTFFGSVGLASRNGFDFLAIYVGPMILFAVFWPFVARVVRIAKAQNITSVADFIGARYGKSQTVAAMVCLIVTVGTIPYVALQMKAVSASLLTTFEPGEIATMARTLPLFSDIALVVALSMAVFAMLFGTRHADATEHQDGLILAVAAESIVKLVCFLAVGIYVTYWMFGGFTDLFARVAARADIMDAVIRWPDASTFLAMSVLSFCCGILLPRMFHVGVVENHSQAEVRRASWLFPIYLVLINLFVVPIAVAGLLSFPPGGIDSDMTVVALPLSRNNDIMTLIAFIGGLSAATAMVIVASVALSIMISNDVVIPSILKWRGRLAVREENADDRSDLGPTILKIRRTIILGVMMAAYVYYRIAGDAQLASIGLLSFAAVSQLAPAFFGGLFWRRATARGAVFGMAIGLMVWGYTLLIPMLVTTGVLHPAILTQGLFGLAALKPQDLFGIGLPPLAHGVFWSLSANIIVFVLASLARRPAAIEQLQAGLFVPSQPSPYAPSFRLWRSAVTVDEVERTVARYLGAERTAAAFRSHTAQRGRPLDPEAEADIELLRHAERLLASAIGTASSRLVLSLLLKKRSVSTTDALKLLDDANAAMQYNREVLQTALEHAQEGVSVFDRDGRLMVWNRPFAEVLDLPPETLHIGASFESVLRGLARRGEFGRGQVEALVAGRVHRLMRAGEPQIERLAKRGMVVEIRSAGLPDGGVVMTFTDVTARIAAAEDLERANETLERRVQERTEELTRLNAELAKAKAEADEANLSKTRFLAAASHDILQPLNAARLYTTSLVERNESGDTRRLVDNVDASLEAVEEILGALLDISRLDAGAMKPEIGSFRIDDLFRQLEVEFAPIAAQKGLALTFVHSSLAVHSDRRLLRRLLQNLVSNAIKYTQTGHVLVGCRRRGRKLFLEVHDTGPGIPQRKQRIIFQEFQRLEQGARHARGLGLGLSIVERIARVLEHRLVIRSKVGKGSCFAVEVPIAPAVPALSGGIVPPMVPAAPLDSLVVLAIDNEPKIIEGMRTLLTGWGCHTLTAAGWKEAQEVLNQSAVTPDVLVVDYHLDSGNGLDVVTQLRWRFGASLPAILITADRSREVREKAAERNVHLLHKPLKPAALRALLTQWRVQKQAAE
ncbi:hybrid sensor histidine kinase/response regulator [Phreatobacter sp.]|uniref:hybrid sensor histidine kinase/response regulator n=1 Tax=Phreatobacter sp. TaxID=1966341 RepID=UPI003F6E7623